MTQQVSQSQVCQRGQRSTGGRGSNQTTSMDQVFLLSESVLRVLHHRNQGLDPPSKVAGTLKEGVVCSSEWFEMRLLFLFFFLLQMSPRRKRTTDGPKMMRRPCSAVSAEDDSQRDLEPAIHNEKVVAKISRKLSKLDVIHPAKTTAVGLEVKSFYFYFHCFSIRQWPDLHNPTMGTGNL